MLHVGTVLSVMHQDIIPRLILIRMAEAEDLPDRVSLLILLNRGVRYECVSVNIGNC